MSSLLSGLRKELEATELQPVKIEVEEKELYKIGITLVVVAVCILSIQAIIKATIR